MEVVGLYATGVSCGGAGSDNRPLQISDPGRGPRPPCAQMPRNAPVFLFTFKQAIEASGDVLQIAHGTCSIVKC